MSTELEWRALAILRASLDTDPGERDAFIDRSCGDDQALQQRVRALIRAAGEADPGDGGLVQSLSSTASPGLLLADRYRLEALLGSGGMGEVWLADRVDSGFEQRVAIKLMHSGLVAMIDRFRRERQILARLVHPNIAHLMDGGTTAEGRPWLALEFVSGRPLPAWCNERRLTAEQRVQLLLPVCDALQFAHRNLVVHRDIKPANLLVTDDGIPKLLDFGIAKLLDDPRDPAAPGTLVMTPAYAAPEQLRGEPVSTATDVFQLGLLLYEVLCGVPAHNARRRRGGDFQAQLPSMEQAWLDLQRDAPAQALAAAAQQRLPQERMQALLRGDLGRIVAAATADDPLARYGSVQQLAEDMQRWLRKMPIQVRQGNWRYRLRKFMSRNKAAVALGTAAMALLIAGVAGVLWQTDVALREARRANAVQNYLFDVFESSVPGAPTAGLPDTRDLLERGRDLAMADRDGDDDVQAAMLTAMARIHRQLGLYDAARELVERALQLRLRLLGNSHPLYRQSLFELAETLRLMYALDEALPVLREVLATGGTLGDSRPLEADVRQSLGTVLSLQYRHDEAIAELQKALQLRAGGAEDAASAANLHALALALDRADRPDDAMALYEEALASAIAIYGPVHAEVAAVLGNYGAMLRPMGRYQQATEVLGEAVAINEQVYEGPHPRPAQHLRNLAAALAYLGRNEEAEGLLQQSLQQTEALYGGDSADVARVAINLGGVQIELRRYETAVATLRNGLRIFEADPGEHRREIGFISLNLGRALRGLGQWDAAEQAIRRTIDIRTGIQGVEHPDTAHAVASLGVLERERGNLAQSAELLRGALASSAAALPAAHPRLAQRHADLAETLLRRGLHEKAQGLFAQALTIAEAAQLDAAHPQVVEARLGLARSAFGTGDLERARAEAREIAALGDDVLAEGDPHRELWAELQRALESPAAPVSAADASSGH